MGVAFKKLNTEDGREFLFIRHKVDSLSRSNEIAKGVIHIIDKHDVASESHMSLASDGLTVVLHGHSKEPITENDWEVAKEIEIYLAKQT